MTPDYKPLFPTDTTGLEQIAEGLLNASVPPLPSSSSRGIDLVAAC